VSSVKCPTDGAESMEQESGKDDRGGTFAFAVCTVYADEERSAITGDGALGHVRT